MLGFRDNAPRRMPILSLGRRAKCEPSTIASSEFLDALGRSDDNINLAYHQLPVGAGDDSMLDLQTATFVVGVGFAGGLLYFLNQAFFSELPDTERRRTIVSFMCAVCAGSCGAFFTGTALLSADVHLANGLKLTFSGSAGIALFALVFLLLRPAIERRVQGQPNKVISPGTNTPFEMVAEQLAHEAGGSIDLSGFTTAERHQLLRSDSLRCATMLEAKQSLDRLQRLVPAGSVRKYSVSFDETSKCFTFTFS